MQISSKNSVRLQRKTHHVNKKHDKLIGRILQSITEDVTTPEAQLVVG